MEYSVGLFSPCKVEVLNKQNKVEFRDVDGYSSEEGARAAAGNVWRDTYDYCYDGYYSNRGQAVKRLQNEIEATERKLADLKFALTVTKKKVWEKVK